MLRKIYITLTAIALLLIQSCAPKLLTKEECDARFKQQVMIDSKTPDEFSFSASAVLSGLPAIIKGMFSKDKDSLSFSSPFGKNILTLERKDDSICIKSAGFQTCNSQQILSMVSLYAPQLSSLTDINLLKGVVSKKFYLSEKDIYQCENGNLKILRKDYTLIYQNGELRQIVYKNYTVDYGSNNQIEIKDSGSTIAKINVSNINFNNN